MNINTNIETHGTEIIVDRKRQRLNMRQEVKLGKSTMVSK